MNTVQERIKHGVNTRYSSELTLDTHTHARANCGVSASATPLDLSKRARARTLDVKLYLLARLSVLHRDIVVGELEVEVEIYNASKESESASDTSLLSFETAICPQCFHEAPND